MSENAVSQTIQGIWSQVLGIPELSLSDNFFAVGGSSMQAFDILEKVNSCFSVNLTISDFFDALTIESLSAVVARTKCS